MTDRISPPSSPQDSNTTGSINEKLNSPITPENKRVSIIANSGKSFADRKMSRRLSTAPTGPPIVESGNDGLTRDVNHSLPGDGLRSNRKSKTQGELAKRRSSYYEEAFQGDREANVMKDRVYGEAIVMVELRTNVIVRNLLPAFIWVAVTDFAFRSVTNSALSRISPTNSQLDTRDRSRRSWLVCSTELVCCLGELSTRPTP